MLLTLHHATRARQFRSFGQKNILILDSCVQNDNAQVDNVQISFSNSSGTLLPQ